MAKTTPILGKSCFLKNDHLFLKKWRSFEKGRLKKFIFFCSNSPDFYENA